MWNRRPDVQLFNILFHVKSSCLWPYSGDVEAPRLRVWGGGGSRGGYTEGMIHTSLDGFGGCELMKYYQEMCGNFKTDVWQLWRYTYIVWQLKCNYKSVGEEIFYYCKYLISKAFYIPLMHRSQGLICFFVCEYLWVYECWCLISATHWKEGIRLVYRLIKFIFHMTICKNKCKLGHHKKYIFSSSTFTLSLSSPSRELWPVEAGKNECQWSCPLSVCCPAGERKLTVIPAVSVCVSPCYKRPENVCHTINVVNGKV